MKNKFFNLTSLIFLFSCSQEPGIVFPVTGSCYTRGVVAELRLSVPGSLVVLDSLLIVLDPISPDYALKAYDKFSGDYLFSGAKVGNGPLEVITPLNIYENQGVHLFDLGKQKIVRYKINPGKTGFITISEHHLPSAAFFSKAVLLDEDQFIVFPEEGQTVVSLKDLANKRDIAIVKNPLRKVDDEIMRDQLAGSVKLDDSGNYLVFAAFNTPYVSLYEYKDGAYEMIFDAFISQPDFICSSGVFKWNEENVVGIMDLAVGNGRIFLLHSNLKRGMAKGRSIEAIPKIMYEFDYSGNPVKLYHLDMRILRLAMDADGGLYGIGMDEQEADFKVVQLMI